MESLYREIGKSRQSYLQQQKREARRKRAEKYLIRLVKQMREGHPRMGSRTMYYTLLGLGYWVPYGVTKFEELLSRSELTVGTAKSRSPKTSDGLGKRSYDNLTNGLSINDINQLLVADITYFRVVNEWCYIFVLKDVYSQRVVSMIPSRDMKASNALFNLKELVALRGESDLEGCILHSDNGSQYESLVFTGELRRLKMKISRSATCSQNGSVEQSNHIIKNMYLEHCGIRSFDDLQKYSGSVQYRLNNERAVKQLGYITVDKFEKQLTVLTPEQRVIKTMYDFSIT